MEIIQYDASAVFLPTLMAELEAAGLGGVQMAVSESGTVTYADSVPQAVRVNVDAVVSAHDPQAGWLSAYAEHKADECKTSGITVNGGTAVPTDPATTAKFNDLAVYCARNPTTPSVSVVLNGEVVTWPPADIVLVADAITAHWLACEETLAGAITEIKNGTITTTAAVDRKFR